MRDLIQKGILTFLLPEIQRGRGYKLKLGWIFPLQKFFRQIFIILKISPKEALLYSFPLFQFIFPPLFKGRAREGL
jgi:hypothetical protein